MPLLASLIACSLSALLQQSPDNAAWLAFADTLSRTTDVQQLKQSADRLRRQRDFRSRLRAGLMYHRIYEIERRQDGFDRAAGLLKDGLNQAPRLPAIYYLAGRALVSGPHVTERGGIVTLRVLRDVVGTSDRERGIEALESALLLDPMFAPAALELGRQAVASREADELRAARAALRPIAAVSGDERISVLLAEVERHLGDPAAAAASLESTPSGTRTTAAVEYQRAMALMLVADRAGEGVAAYWRGTAALDAQTAQAYFNDLSYIVTRKDAESWKGAPLNEKAAWLRRFWSLEAARAGITIDERIITHYRRLAYARENYPRSPSIYGRLRSRVPAPGAGPSEILEDPDAHQRDIDDRGLVWVKYGEPDHRITARLDYEGWVYERDGRNINFFFMPSDSNGASGKHGYSLFSGLPRECGDFLVHAARYEPELQKAYTGGCLNPDPNPLLFRTVASTLSARARENLERNDARPRFEREVPFHYSLYTLDGANNASTLLAAVAIPAERVTRGSDGAYHLRASLIVIDTATGAVARSDTILRLRSERTLGSHEYIRAYLQLNVAPSHTTTYVIALVDRNAESAGQIYGGPRTIEAFTNTLALSDLILADTTTGGGWRRGKASLDLVPMQEYPGGVFNLFYEIYNLPAGTYRTRVRIEPTDGATRRLLERALGRRRSSIELAFDGQAASATATTQELRRVGTELPAGRYRITVTVVDSRGREARRTTVMRVSPPTQ